MTIQTNVNIDRAIKAAKTNPVVGLPRMAAVLTCKSGNYYVGYNSRKTHPLMKQFGKNEKAICIHAEIDAIRRCWRSGDTPFGGSMAVARVLKSGVPAMAKPCEGCQRALIAFGIQSVEWTE